MTRKDLFDEIKEDVSPKRRQTLQSNKSKLPLNLNITVESELEMISKIHEIEVFNHITSERDEKRKFSFKHPELKVIKVENEKAKRKEIRSANSTKHSD